MPRGVVPSRLFYVLTCCTTYVNNLFLIVNSLLLMLYNGHALELFTNYKNKTMERRKELLEISGMNFDKLELENEFTAKSILEAMEKYADEKVNDYKCDVSESLFERFDKEANDNAAMISIFEKEGDLTKALRFAGIAYAWVSARDFAKIFFK